MKLSSFSSLAICGLILASCGGNKTAKTGGEAIFEPVDYTLAVSNIENADSNYLYLYDFDAAVDGMKEAVIDSVMILGGQANVDVKGSTAPVVMLMAGNRGPRVLFYPQAGENTFNWAE